MKAVLVLAVLVLAASSTVADSPPSHMIPIVAAEHPIDSN